MVAGCFYLKNIMQRIKYGLDSKILF